MRPSIQLWFWCLWASMGLPWLLAGCGVAESYDGDIGQLVFEDPVDSDAEPGGELPSVSWLGLAPSGELSWWDGATGATLATAPTGVAGSAEMHDLSFDPVEARAVWLRGAATAGEPRAAVVARRMRLSRPNFGNTRRLGAARASAQLTAVPAGMVLFEGGDRPRWRLLPRDGRGAGLLAQSPPLALWGHSGSASLDAVVRGEHRGARIDHWLTVDAEAGGFTIVRATPLSYLLPQAGKPVHAAPHRDGVLVARLLADQVALSSVSRDGQLRFTHWLKASARRLAQVIPIDSIRSRHERYALLFAEPTELWVVDLGDPLRHPSLSFDGDVKQRGAGFARHLVAHGLRLWLATDAGVFAARAAAGRSGLELHRDDRFHGERLRGPLAGPVLTAAAPKR